MNKDKRKISEELVEENGLVNEQTLKENTLEVESWKETLTKEVKKLAELSEKAAKQESYVTEEVQDNAKLVPEDIVQDVSDSGSTKTSNSPGFSSVHVVDEKTVDFLPKEDDFESSETGESSHGKAEKMVVNDIPKDGNAESTESKDRVGQNQHMSEKIIDQELNSQKPKTEKSDDTLKRARTTSKTVKHGGKEKARGKKRKSRKKEMEMEDWLDKEDYYDYYEDDEAYDGDVDDDMADDEMEDFHDDVDILDEEKPSDEIDDFDDGEVERKLKEQEELQEEIKHLKGFFFRFVHFFSLSELMIFIQSHFLAFLPLVLFFVYSHLQYCFFLRGKSRN